MTQTLFDASYQPAHQAKEEAIERVGRHANPEWLETAFAAIVCAACTLVDFTADDVRERLDENVTTHEPAALGHVFRAAQKAGLIRQCGFQRMTRDPIRHRHLTVWTRA